MRARTGGLGSAFLATATLLWMALGVCLRGIGEDGAFAEECRTNWTADPGESPPIVCAEPCAGGCVENHVQVASDPPIEHYFCRCGQGSEPDCCHLYINMVDGAYEGSYADGYCADEHPDFTCKGARNTTCKKVPVAVPVGQPAKRKAVCGFPE